MFIVSGAYLPPAAMSCGRALITGGVAAGPRNANVYFCGVLRILEVAPLGYDDRL
ncbi:hypothetical protein [Bradyrhizobium sp. 191]|uniref:hypothetical protein n=1 Tax=Bradyrhizobium sp. 191 TaxID=2782659 RepID=UPI001FFF6B20|nr:hypothetical protein [Bradyrhizobium sp. 191]UPJ64031.1 hypothetical protein IVB23_29245 [Bradyrhizobium sp. 191]